jgi:competence protein ComEC
MDSPKLVVLDVGHGNCAVLVDGEEAAVIDCAPGSTLHETLEQLQIYEIQYVFLSHVDRDHCAGLTGLLLNGIVRNVYLNPDPRRDSKTWQALRIALKKASDSFGTKIHPRLSTAPPLNLRCGRVDIEVLSPSLDMTMSGVSGEDLQARELTANSMSAVLGLTHDGCRVALFPGDIDEVGLAHLLEAKEIEAKILVFPHHGGKSKTIAGDEFASQLCEAVKPELVLFSIGRERYNNPREEVVRGVKSASPGSHVLCTQLSRSYLINVEVRV